MKYCPHCGAVLQDGAFAFCPECGKDLGLSEPAAKHPAKKKKQKKAKSPKLPAAEIVEQLEDADQQDEANVDYDGYYDDVLPEDSGKIGDGIDKYLMKKVIGMICGLVIVIAACIALMHFL